MKVPRYGRRGVSEVDAALLQLTNTVGLIGVFYTYNVWGLIS